MRADLPPETSPGHLIDPALRWLRGVELDGSGRRARAAEPGGGANRNRAGSLLRKSGGQIVALDLETREPMWTFRGAGATRGAPAYGRAEEESEK